MIAQRGKVLLLSTLALAAPAAVPAATIIYTNFGTGQSYYESGGNPVGNGLDGTGNNYA